MKNEEKKADMYLPTWVLGTGIFFAVCAELPQLSRL